MGGGSRSEGQQSRGCVDKAALWGGVEGPGLRGGKGEARVWSQVGVRSPGVARFRTDQSDVSCCINSTVGQHNFNEHPQVGAPILQMRGRQGSGAPSIPGRGGGSSRELDLWAGPETVPSPTTRQHKGKCDKPSDESMDRWMVSSPSSLRLCEVQLAPSCGACPPEHEQSLPSPARGSLCNQQKRQQVPGAWW